MSDRETTLNRLFMPLGITIGGKELKPLAFGRRDLLKHVGNSLFCESDKRNQSSPMACAEMVLVCTLTPEECEHYDRLSVDERDRIVRNFAIKNEGELESAIGAINQRNHENQLAQMESVDGGKGVQRHA